MATTNLGRIGFVSKGTWVAGPYKNLDVVRYNNALYICKVPSTTSVPTTTTDWDLYVDSVDTYTKDEADSNFVDKTTAQTIAGIKTFSSSPIVPDSVNDNEVTNQKQLARLRKDVTYHKRYVNHEIGDDTNNGFTSGSPKLTIKAAIESVPSGLRAEIILSGTTAYPYIIDTGINIYGSKIVLRTGGRTFTVTSDGHFRIYDGSLWLERGTFNIACVAFVHLYEGSKLRIGGFYTVTFNIGVNDFRCIYNTYNSGHSISYLTAFRWNVYEDSGISGALASNNYLDGITKSKFLYTTFPINFNNTSTM